MRKPPTLRDVAQALEYWVIAALVLASFVVGAWGGVMALLG